MVNFGAKSTTGPTGTNSSPPPHGRKEETKTISIPSHFNRFLVMGANTKTEKETEGVEDLTGMTDGSCVLVKNMDSEASNVEAGNDTNQSGDNYAKTGSEDI